MTSTEFNAWKMAIPGKGPFAGGASASVIPPGATTGDFSIPDGFGNAFDAAPLDDGTNMVQRGQMNYIGKMASYAPFFFQTGGIYTFDPVVAAAIGGYPKDAILTKVEGQSYIKVMSLVENNTVNFNLVGIDGENWTRLNMPNELDEPIEICNVDTGSIGDDSSASVLSYQVCTFKTPRNGIVSTSVKLGELTIVAGLSKQLVLYMSWKQPSDASWQTEVPIWAYGSAFSAVTQPQQFALGTLLSVRLQIDNCLYDNINIKLTLV